MATATAQVRAHPTPLHEAGSALALVLRADNQTRPPGQRTPEKRGTNPSAQPHVLDCSYRRSPQALWTQPAQPPYRPGTREDGAQAAPEHITQHRNPPHTRLHNHKCLRTAMQSMHSPTMRTKWHLSDSERDPACAQTSKRARTEDKEDDHEPSDSESISDGEDEEAKRRAMEAASQYTTPQYSPWEREIALTRWSPVLHRMGVGRATPRLPRLVALVGRGLRVDAGEP